MASLDMLIDAVDANDRVIGKVVRRQALGYANFRVVHILIFDSHGKVLVQQIGPGLRHAGWWGSSVAGYLRAGENYLQAAQRKLVEELGLRGVDVENVGLTSMHDQGSTKFIGVFTAKFDGVVHATSAGVSTVEFVPVSTVRTMSTTGLRAFTPTFLHVLAFVQRKRGGHP